MTGYREIIMKEIVKISLVLARKSGNAPSKQIFFVDYELAETQQLKSSFTFLHRSSYATTCTLS